MIFFLNFLCVIMNLFHGDVFQKVISVFGRNSAYPFPPSFSAPLFFPAYVASFHSNILVALQAHSVSVVCISAVGKYSLGLF